MTEKKKIGLKKQDFNWAMSEEKSSKVYKEISTKDNSLSDMVDSVNQDSDSADIELSKIAKNRNEQRVIINGAVDAISTNLKDNSLGKSEVSKSREFEQEKYSTAVDNIHLDLHEEIASKLAAEKESYTDDLSNIEELKAQEGSEKSSFKSVLAINSQDDIHDFKTNIKEMWKSILGIAILLITIVIAISYKDSNSIKTSAVSVNADLVSATEKSTSSESLLVLGDKNNGLLTNVDVPSVKFEASDSKKDNNVVKGLTLLSILHPPGKLIFGNISLHQWPNAVNLKEVPSSNEEVTELFPQNLYKRVQILKRV